MEIVLDCIGRFINVPITVLSFREWCTVAVHIGPGLDGIGRAGAIPSELPWYGPYVRGKCRDTSDTGNPLDHTNQQSVITGASYGSEFTRPIESYDVASQRYPHITWGHRARQEWTTSMPDVASKPQ